MPGIEEPLALSRHSDAFERFAGRSSAIVIHRQDVLNAFLGPAERHFDLRARTLTGGGQVLGGLTSMGSFSHLSRTWLWSWANPNFSWDDPAVAPLRAVHDHGRRHGIVEFTTGHIDFSGFPNPHQAAITMVLAAAYLLGGNGCWSCRINDGKGSAYIHLDDPQIPEAAYDPLATPRLLMTAAEVFPADPKLIVQGYLARYGTSYKESADTVAGDMVDGGELAVRFDAHGRIAALSCAPGRS
ncbi:hypothetical protein DZF91_15815 [Actinomadura logoneensis]|uniref:Uncharacterized protein n=1 Tax=Actinomadura logoneensis TaxID=2293572 RepID=A0A372JL80_9ACTN|nr:DUF6882 domain-containing protein [Actinomadura logoneensis]RFU40689.1 hypothetical protein DZF91_15815 [Actinomadura logoneensis]